MSDIVYFDSCVFLAWLREEQGRVDIVASLFQEAKDGKLKILTSTLAIAEVLNINGLKSPIPKENREMVKGLFANEWIFPENVTRRVSEVAQELVWEYGIDPKDAIHIATAILHGVGTVYSYDDPLLKKGFVKTTYGSIVVAIPTPPPQGVLILH